MFIDLHTHTIFSDGELLPSELVSRAASNNYYAIALTDHVDFSNIDIAIPRIRRVVKDLSRYYKIKVVAGCEITYVPPPLIKKAVARARGLGAQIVVVHGETPSENVPRGTNRAGILSGADILAHPGYITEDEVNLAAQRGVFLEITTRKGHREGNPHLARLAIKNKKARLILDTDTHSPDDIVDPELKKILPILKTAGLSRKYYDEVMIKNSLSILKKIQG